MSFPDLINQRWTEAQRRLGLPIGAAQLTWEVTDDYPHFKKKRGFAVCFYRGGSCCHLKFSPKILKAPLHRADAILRHELCHVLDFVIDGPALDSWALHQGIQLPSTPERRADALAMAIWFEPILYDKELVQSTRQGQDIRPAHLGL